ncbi:hypothetical protein Tco_0867400 [Tanacetum coccineum]
MDDKEAKLIRKTNQKNTKRKNEDDSSSEFADVNKSSADDTEDNANDKDNEDTSSAQEEQNNEDSESLETPPIKRRGRSKKSVRTNENTSSSIKKRGRPRKSNDEEKKQTIGSQGRSVYMKWVLEV